MTIEKGELATSVKKNVKTKIIYFGNAGKGKLLHWLLLSLAYWLMLERRLCVYNAGLKVDASEEILTGVMTSYYENVRSCKRHTVVRRVLFLRCALLFLGLSTHYRESWYLSSLVDPSSNTVSKRLWTLIKNKKKDHTGVSPLVDHGITYTDPQAKADLLANYFSSIFTTENTEL